MIRKLAFALLFLVTSANLAAAPGEGGRTSIRLKDGKLVAINGKKLPRVEIGFSPLDLTPPLREFFGAPKERGVLVQLLKEGGPAATAGLRVGDIVTAIDGVPLDYSWAIGDALEARDGGETVQLEVVREKHLLTLPVTLEARELPAPGVQQPASYYIDTDGELRAKLEILQKRLKELEKEVRKP